MRTLLLPPPQAVSKTTNAKTLAKSTTAQITTLPPTSIDHAADTIITLPSSKKTIVIQKGLPANMIAELDKYFKTNKNLKTKNITVSPNTVTCGLHIATYWQLVEQYQPISGKHIGIWTNILSPRILHDQYGFTYYMVGFGESGDTSITNYFPLSNLMVNVPYNVNQQEIQNDPAYNYYYLDEPLQNGIANSYFLNMASWISNKNPDAFFLFSDYYWPLNNITCYPMEDDGNRIETYWFPNQNVRIMCDQYSGNLCGSAHDYWDEYKGYYGMLYRNLTNFITLNPDKSNNGADWGDLLNLASSWYMNPIWVYGLDSNVDESTISYFANTAWSTGYLYELEKQVTTVWKCLEYPSCTDCVYPTQGGWYVYESYYTGEQQYVAY